MSSTTYIWIYAIYNETRVLLGSEPGDNLTRRWRVGCGVSKRYIEIAAGRSARSSTCAWPLTSGDWSDSLLVTKVLIWGRTSLRTSTTLAFSNIASVLVLYNEITRFT
jgi:hypothetical protein